MKELYEGTDKFQQLKKEWLSFNPKTEEELFAFIHKLTTEYNHDYGTSVHMCVALIKALFEYVNELEGYTGFQVGCMMWEVIEKVFCREDKIGMRLQRYEDLLYPQFIKDFTTVELTKNQLEKLKQLAKKNLEEKDIFCAVKVRKHWERIANGVIPFGIKVKE